MLLRARWWMVRNYLRRMGWDDAIKIIALAALGIFFMILEFFTVGLLTDAVMGQERLGPLRILLIVKIMNMLFLMFMAMLFYSSLIASLGQILLAGDLELLLSFPIPLARIFWSKFTFMAMAAGWMFIVFGVPVFASYGFIAGAPAWFYLHITVLLVLFMLIPVSLGAGITLVAARFFPAYRARHILSLFGLIFGIALIVIVRMMRPEQLLNPMGAEVMATYLRTMRLPSPWYLPSTWMAEGIQAAVEGRPWDVLRQGAWVAAAAAACLTGLHSLTGRVFFASISRSQVRTEKAPGGSITVRTGANRPYTLPFITKDLKLFFRDGAQWSQLLILGALVFVYIFNFKHLPLELFNYTYMMSFVSLGATGLIMAAVGARFAYPALSAEGVCLWLLRSSPGFTSRFLRQQFLFALLPNLLLGVLLSLFAAGLLGVSRGHMFLSVVVTAAMAFGLSGLALGIG
ncbi:hypothetical protein JW905_02300, partial [bacterium]|nr:hypothetical protein [candidate division CSSED10-310 bacterium]